MDWIQGLKNAIDYIEEHITEKLIMKKWLSARIRQIFIFKEYLELCVVLLLVNIFVEEN